MTATVRTIDLPDGGAWSPPDPATATAPGARPDHGLDPSVAVGWLGDGTTSIETGRFRVVIGCTRPRIPTTASRAPLPHRRRTAPSEQEAEADREPDLLVLSQRVSDHRIDETAHTVSRDVPILVGRRSARTLRAHGFRDVTPIDMWQRIILRRGPDEMRITTVPSPRTGFPRPSARSGLGSLVEVRQNHGMTRFFVDASVHSDADLQRVPSRFPGVDAAVMCLGRSAGLAVLLDAGPVASRHGSAPGPDESSRSNRDGGRSASPAVPTRRGDRTGAPVFVHHLQPGERFVLEH